MNKLEQIMSDVLIKELLPPMEATTNPIEGWFAFKDNELIGVIGAEIFEDSKSVMLHIKMNKDKRTPKRIKAFAWLIKQVVYPLFKARGFVRCVSNCSPDNTAVQKFMKLCGAKLTPLIMAEYLL